MRKINDYSKLCKKHKVGFLTHHRPPYKQLQVETVGDSVDELLVDFDGPKDSLYEGGKWKLRVMLPNDYPFKSPR